MDKANQFYVTQPAYDYLTKLALKATYCTSKVYARGLATFLNDLSKQSFTDKRPLSIREMTIPMLESGLLPPWIRYESFYAQARYLRLSAEAILHYIDLSNEFGIRRHHDSAKSLVSATLEAIGSEWLVPDQLPNTPPPRRPEPRRNTYTDI